MLRIVVTTDHKKNILLKHLTAFLTVPIKYFSNKLYLFTKDVNSTENK